MSQDHHDIYERIAADPKFHQLVKQRSRWAWGLSAIILLLYFSFILLIAFAPEILGTPINPTSLISIGIPIGILIIVMAFLLTGIYVRKANRDFDRLNNDIVEDARR